MNTSRKDFLILGGGIAGTVLALQLLEKGFSFTMYDKYHEGTASRVAAGIINPVTGQRFVKSWMYDALIDSASYFYNVYDTKWDTQFFKFTKIQRALFKQNEISNFELREADEFYNQHFDNEKVGEQKRHFKEVGDWCCINGARLNLAGFIARAKEYIVNQGAQVKNETFDFQSLHIQNEELNYDDQVFSKMICCEGIGILKNPYFNYLPMVPAKGESLILQIPSIDTKDIYKHKVFFVPLDSQNHFWVGANYDWDFETGAPTPEGYEWLLDKVTISLKVPFKVARHIAAIRPTGKDRRPYLGAHPEHANLFVFNALGTKGASLAPYFANHLLEHVEAGQTLNKEVSINRFTKNSLS